MDGPGSGARQPAEAGSVSWIAADRGGLLYLFQRGDDLDPIVVIDHDGHVLRSWGKGMYTMPHAIRVDPQGNIWTVDAATSIVRKYAPDGRLLMQIDVGGRPAVCMDQQTVPESERPMGQTTSAAPLTSRLLQMDTCSLPTATRTTAFWNTAATGRG